MKEWIKNHKILVLCLLLLVAGVVYLLIWPKNPTILDDSAKKPEVQDNQKNPTDVSQKTRTSNDPFLKHYKLVDSTKQELRAKKIELGEEIKSNNGMPDAWNGFNQKINSLNAENLVDSDYYNENINAKKIDGVYYVRNVEGVPTLYKLGPNDDVSYEVDIVIPPNSAKHKMLSDKYFGYISDVDVEQIGKTVTVVDLETNQERKIDVSIPEMRIASFFANPEGNKIVIAEEYPPTVAENFATSDTLHHRVWVYNLENLREKPSFIFDQQEDIMERWPIFWSKEDNKIYFNSCDVQDLQCNFGITRTSPNSDDRELVAGLEVGTYASQPVLSPNGRHLAYVAWNGNQETPLYVEGDDKNNQFLNKNAIWVYDIKTGEKKKILDFGNYRVIDHLFWSPDGMYVYFELRQLVKGLDGKIHPTSNSAGFWRLDLTTAKFNRIAQDITISPGQLLSHFTPVPDGSGVLFTVTKMFPKTTFLDIKRKVEKVEYYLRLQDMKLIELGDNVTGVFKIEPL